jgi:uncharacterized protein CbrC (UPF0167 family)
MDLPFFKYHPDPLSTGSIKASTNRYVVCGQVRGYVYAKQPYKPGKCGHDSICPWCIADGSAHKKLDIFFVEELSIGNNPHRQIWEKIPEYIAAEVVFRTPSFFTIQPESWFTHCHDAAAFLGCMGDGEPFIFNEKALKALQKDTGFDDDQEWQQFLKDLDHMGSPRLYLFQCLHCGAYGGYYDCD